jgi:hypothetical protein
MRQTNRLLQIFFRCEQSIHEKYGNDPEMIERGAPPPWSQQQWDWFQQRIKIFESNADWATEQEMKTMREWLGASAAELNRKDPILRSCVEGLVYTINKFLRSKGVV